MKKEILVPLTFLLWLVLTAQSEPEVVALEFIWLSILAFFILLIVIVWILLRFKKNKSARLK